MRLLSKGLIAVQSEKVINFMNQNIRALKEIEEIIHHDEKQQISALSIEEMDQLKSYIGTMKGACEAAIKLASSYKTTAPKPTNKKTTKANSRKAEKNSDIDEVDDSEFEDLLK